MGVKKLVFPRLGSELKYDWFEKVRLDSKFFVFMILITLPLFFFKSFGIIFLLIVSTIAVSYLAQKMKLKKFGVELVTFTTVVTGVSFGALPGAVVGVLLMIIHHIITKRIGFYWVIVMPVFGLIGALAGIYPHANLFVLGIGLTLFSHLVYIIFQKIMFKSSGKYLFYLALNLLFNAVLFHNFAKIVVNLTI